MFFLLQTFDFAPHYPDPLQRAYDRALAHRIPNQEEQQELEVVVREGLERRLGELREEVRGLFDWDREMAPPHTMKRKDEMEGAKMMNPPLSAIINGAKVEQNAKEMGMKSNQGANTKIGGGDNLKSVEKMAGFLKSSCLEDEERNVDLKLLNGKYENASNMAFVEKETNIIVDKKDVSVIKGTLKRKDPGDDRQRPAIEKKESESVLDLSRKVEAMKLDVLGTLSGSSTPRTSGQSSTSLTPGLEGLHLTSGASTPKTIPQSQIPQSQNSKVLAQAAQNINFAPSTPKKRTTPNSTIQRTPEQKHAAVTTSLQNFRSSPKTSPKLSPQADEKVILRSNVEIAGKVLVDKSIEEIVSATEALCASDSEEGWRDVDTRNVLRLVEGNRCLVRGVRMIDCFTGVDFDGEFGEGVKEIEDLIGEWDGEGEQKGVYPDGDWDEVICRLGGLDEVVVGEWKIVKERFEVRKKGDSKDDEEGVQEIIGLKTDEESVGESDDAQEDDEDDGNESMEYIAPGEIAAKEEKQDAAISFEGFGALKAPGMAPTSVLTTPLPSKIFNFDLAQSSTAIKSTQVSSPVQATPTPAQAIPVAPLLSKSFDFTFAPASMAEKSSRSASPVQATPTLAQSMPSAPLPSKAFDFAFSPATKVPPLPPPSASLHSPPIRFEFAPAATTTSSPQLSIPLPTNDSEKKAATAPTIFGQIISGSPAKAIQPLSQPIFNFNPAFTSTPPQISTPPFTPNLSISSLSQPRESKTPSTLCQLTKSTQALQTSIETLHSALYGLDPSTQAPQSAKDSGLLLMNNNIGEWVTDIRITTSSLGQKVNEMGSLVQNLERYRTSHQELVKGVQETANLAYIAARSTEEKAQKNTEVLSEIKDLLLKNEKQTDFMKDCALSTLVKENNELKEQLAKTSAIERQDVGLLRAEHRALNGEVARLTRRLELYVEYQRGVAESDALMEIIWPQGWETIVPSEKGVFADDPGFTKDEKEKIDEVVKGNQAGGRGGKPGSGWCVVM